MGSSSQRWGQHTQQRRDQRGGRTPTLLLSTPNPPGGCRAEGSLPGLLTCVSLRLLFDNEKLEEFSWSA